MNLFYATEIKDGFIHLPTEEVRHVAQVLRKKAGESLFVVDGEGNFYETTIAQLSKKEGLLKIEQVQEAYGQRPYRVHIGIAPTKNIDRLEWFLEKATEIGIDEITPILCFHSERKHIRADRLEKVLVSAMKQSLKAYLPRLNPLIKLNEFLASQSESQATQLIGYCEEGVKEHLKDNYKAGSDVVILIGPEGDFNENEVALAQEVGFKPVTFGESRLRTETAGVVACSFIQILNAL